MSPLRPSGPSSSSWSSSSSTSSSSSAFVAAGPPRRRRLESTGAPESITGRPAIGPRLPGELLTRIASYVAGDCDQSLAAVVELAAWQEAAVPDPGKLRAGEELRQMVHEGRGDLLWHFPAEERTHSLCLAAVRSFGMALRWVPPEHITPGMCEAALKNDGLALQWVVPPTRITSEMCYAAVRTAALALAFAPEKHLTPKLSEAAVRANWRALAFVPEAHLRERLFSIALNQDARALRLIPAGYRTLETYTLAFRRGFLPNDLLREERTTEVLRAAADVARQDQRVHAAVPALDASAR